MIVLSTAFAPRVSGQLVRLLGQIDNESVPIAETSRRLGRLAARLGQHRPSYQCMRVLVHRLRRLRRRRGPSTARVLFEVSANLRLATDLLDLAAGIPLPP